MGRVRAIVANIGSAVMMEAPPSAYLRSLAAVTPRKLWQAWPGDCVVTLAPCSDVFCDYVSGVLEMDVGDVDIVAPRELRGGHPLEFAAELGAADIVAARGALSPFVLDDPVLAFAQRTGMTIVPYASLPDATTLDTVRRINTKRGFREIASSLGLPVAVGGYAATPAELVVQLEVFLRGHTRAIVKIDRASNGCGNTVIAGDAAVAVAEQVRDMLAGQPQRGCGWVFEEYLPLDSVPSIEMLVTDAGVTGFYTCDQRSVNNAWTGMVTPARQGKLADTLLNAATTIGQWLHGQGYRGIFDVDCGVFDGAYVVTEANVRRTGGTYLEELARRLARRDSGDTSPLHWCADARRGSTTLDFAGAVKALDLAGLASPAAPARAILTADTLAVDGKWRYLVVGRDADAVADAEVELLRLLEIA